jgi:hypothetical protein
LFEPAFAGQADAFLYLNNHNCLNTIEGICFSYSILFLPPCGMKHLMKKYTKNQGGKMLPISPPTAPPLFRQPNAQGHLNSVSVSRDNHSN